MTKERSMRIGFCLLAGVLFGMPILTVGFAAEARTHHHHAAHSAHSAPANVTPPLSNQNATQGIQKSEEHNAPNPRTAPDKANDDKQPGRHSPGVGQGGNEGVAGSANTGAGMKENNLPDVKALGPVDTSNTIVRPRLQGAKAEMTRRGASKTNPKGGKYFHTRQAFIRHKNNPVVRNTIGVSIVPRDAAAGQRRMPVGAPPDKRPDVQEGAVKVSPGAPPAGVFHPNRDTGQALANRGGISGSSFPHHGFVPAALGGQTKMNGALNGSTVRPKY
jgi:hypothetical protein